MSNGNHRLTGDIGSGAMVGFGWVTVFTHYWLPEIITVLSAIGTIMGICWYVMQFYEWLKQRKGQ